MVQQCASFASGKRRMSRTFQKFYEQSENISVRFSNCTRCEISIEGLTFVQGRKKADKRKSLSREMSYVTYRFRNRRPRATRVCGLMLILKCRFVGLGRKNRAGEECHATLR